MRGQRLTNPNETQSAHSLHAVVLAKTMNMILPGLECDTAKAEDVVLTPDAIAADIIRHFRPSGRILDPCKGAGAFWNKMPGAEWCESREGRDFFAWYEPVDWIVSNPPYSIFSEWLEHSLKIADEIVYLIPLAKVYNSEPRLRSIMKWGGIVETRHYGSGTDCGFPFGFPSGAVHLRKGYRGQMAWSFYCQNDRGQAQRPEAPPDHERNEK